MKKTAYIAPVTETVNVEVESYLVAPSNWSVDGDTIPISNGGGNTSTPEEPTGAKMGTLWQWDDNANHVW
jgi:hypothetical protein